MGWQCKLCESLNTDETAVCEVCNGIDINYEIRNKI